MASFVIAVGSAAGAPLAAKAVSVQSAPSTYRLADTWTSVPRQSVAGRYLGAMDVSSLVDDRLLVLGRAEGLKTEGRMPSDEAVHVLDPDGTPLALLPLGNEFDAAASIDAGFGATFDVLGRNPRGGWRVDEIGVDGAVLRQMDIGPDGDARDLAAGAAGTFYVSRGSLGQTPDRVEIYAATGQLLTSIVPDELHPGGPGDPYQYRLSRLDVSQDGTLYVMAQADRHCQPTPTTPTPTSRWPTPEPTERPSSNRGGQGPKAAPAEPGQVGQAEPPCTKQIVLVFGSDHRFREELPNTHMSDIAVGASGVYVSAGQSVRRGSQRVYELGSQRLVYTYAAPEALDVPLPMGSSELRLDVAPDGRLRAAADLGDPFYRGALSFGDPVDPTPTGYRPQALGVYERPPLAGPQFPRRVDAGAALSVLEAPYQLYGPTGVPNTYVDVAHDAEAVQTWTTQGQLIGQAVYHDELLRDGATASGEYHIVDPLVDVAVDGADTFMLANQVIWSRPDPLAPTWYQHIPGTHLIAASADNGKLAVLNDAGRRVLVLDRSGRVLADRSIAADWTDRLASDLALDGDQLYLADEGRSTVMVRGLDGSDRGEWPTYAPPRRLSVAPDGTLLVLGRGGLAFRYSPTGELEAYWRLPLREGGVKVEPTDLAVGDDGRVYVTFVGLAEPEAGAQPEERQRGWDILSGGVWVFEASAGEAAPLPPADHPACIVDAAKSVEPGQVLLGEGITVTLHAEGDCPGHHEPQQLMLVVDTSWSMHDLFYPDNPTPGALRRAQEVMSALLAAIDPHSVEIGLVTFSGGARVDVPLPGDLGEVRSRLLTRRADGDTVMGAAVELARQELRGPKGRPDWKQTILVITDGLFHDQPKDTIDAARADGIEVAVVVMTTQGLDDAARQRLEDAVGDPSLLFVDPLPETAARLVDRVSTWVPGAQLFESAAIEDRLPANMAYVPGSASPPATFDAASGTLHWDLGAVPAADGLTLTYGLVPQEAGLWPTNVRASARYVDGTGTNGDAVFPVPEVRVVLPVPTATPTFTPTITPSPSPTATHTPWPTVTPPGPGRIFLPLAAQPMNCIGKSFHADVVLVLDESTSMSARTSSGRTKHEAAIDAARQFVSLLRLEGDSRGYDQVAIAAFNDRSWLALELTSDRSLVGSVLDALASEVREGTRLDLALDEAARALQSAHRQPQNLAAVVLLTDGWPNQVPTPAPSGGQEDTVLAAAQRLKDGGVRIYTVGLGEPTEIWEWLMVRVATRPAFYYYSRGGENLTRIYKEILASIVCGREAE